jgi:uncharacterized ferredoxin-like protein
MRQGIGLFQSDPVQDERLRRLAKDIEALAEKDETLLRRTRDIAALRRAAAVELHAVCYSFVQGVNRLLARPAVELDPPDFREENFRDDLPNLIQINVRGRILQVEFEATPELVSTEDFRIPYTLSGAIRAFNQALLDKDLIEEQLIFYTVEKDKSMWRFFDARTYRSGSLDREYLIGLMEQLV